MTFTEIKQLLRGKTVGIAGAGGLGSNCAVALARVGVGKLVIADFDVIDESNLNRQYYFYKQIGVKKVLALQENLSQIAPSVQVQIFDMQVEKEHVKSLFSGCDVLVEAFDNAAAKKMLIETAIEQLPDIPIVSGIGMAGFGASNSIKMEQYDRLYICGDQSCEVSKNMPPLAPRVGIVANMQANTVLEILLS